MSKSIGAAEGLVAQPLAGLHTYVGVAGWLAIHFYFHFIDFYATHSVVRNVKVTVERVQLLKL